MAVRVDLIENAYGTGEWCAHAWEPDPTWKPEGPLPTHDRGPSFAVIEPDVNIAIRRAVGYLIRTRGEGR